MRAEVVFAAGCVLGESPWWDADADELVWVDIESGRVHRGDPATGYGAVTDHGQLVAAAVPRRSGGYVLARRADIVATRGSTSERLAALDDLPADLRFNDGNCDAAGRLWIGTMSAAREPNASLYRLDPDGGLTPQLRGLTVSNGLGWSLDHATMYHVDTPTAGIDAIECDLDSGSLGTRRRFGEIPDRRPDGLTVDAEGGVWVALFRAGAVHRYSPTGELTSVVEVPTPLVTSCAFGGRDLDELFITSAGAGGDDPLAGSVFRCRPGMRGRLPASFAG